MIFQGGCNPRKVKKLDREGRISNTPAALNVECSSVCMSVINFADCLLGV